MSERCGNCVFARQVDGVSSGKRLCTNKAGQLDRWVVVCADDHCDNYYVSHLAMMRDSAHDKKYKGARAIPLTRGMYTLVDECDYPQLAQYKWCMSKNGRMITQSISNVIERETVCNLNMQHCDNV